MKNIEESLFMNEISPDLNGRIEGKQVEEILPILQEEKVILVLGNAEEHTPFHYIENRKTGKKYIMCFTSFEDLKAWKERAGMERPNIAIERLEHIYFLASIDELKELGGIVLNPCTSNQMIDIDLFIDQIKRPDGVILKEPKNVPPIWVDKMKKLFSKEKAFHKAYLQVESGKDGERYLLILDVEEAKQKRILNKLVVLSKKYANLPVVYANLKANPSLENTLEPFYKK